MKGILRRALAMLMATLMVLSSMPLTAIAEIVEISSSVQPGRALLGIVDDTHSYLTYTFKIGDEEIGTQIVKTGDVLYAPASPEKEGYKFLGWYTADDQPFTAFGTQDSVTETKEIVLTAKFAEVHYVFFMDNEGRVYATREGIEGDTINADVTFPVNAEEGIVGWYTDEALTNRVDSVTLGTQNVTLWPKVERGYWITYHTGNQATYLQPTFVRPGM